MSLEKFYPHDQEGYSIIEINIDKLDELFHSLDHSVIHKKDLDPNVDQYIFESVEELGTSKKRIAFFCKNGCDELKNIDIAERGVRQYFNYRYDFYKGHLQSKMFQAVISLIIGTGFLFLYVFLSNLHTDNMTVGVIEEGFLIIGWVALWKPIEILLYDWRIEFKKYKIYSEITRTDISITNHKN